MLTPPRASRAPSLPPVLCSLGLLLLATACSDNDNARTGDTRVPPSFVPTDAALSKDDPLPGILVTIVETRGATGSGGAFRPGDPLEVRFTVKKTDGSDWDLRNFFRAGILVSGPTDNYQRVVPEQADVASAAIWYADGSYGYRLRNGLPATFAAPYNDSESFGEADGERTGQPLIDGTYSIGLILAWNFTRDGAPDRDAGNATAQFRIGTSGDLVAREVVTQENCNQCHGSLRAHGGTIRDVSLCMMCHTAGAEDRNVATVADGTPGVTIDSRDMFHRIHNAKYLPSGLGIATNADGSRNYSAPKKRLQYVGFQDRVFDFSEVAFPVMPSAYTAFLFNNTGTTYLGTGGNGPMPRDVGYSALSGAQKELEDRSRTAGVACAKCHGDPDGDGPLAAPQQADRIWQVPERVSCASCHDDIDWTKPYTANNQTMPAQLTNATCALCHTEAGDSLSVRDAHIHPYDNPAFNTGVNIEVTDVASGTGPAGNLAATDPFIATFRVRNDAGADLPLNRLTRFQMIVSGPTSNPQWVTPNVNALDVAFRKSTPFTGNGTISTPTIAPTAAAQTIAVAMTGATTFDVVGSVTPPLAGQVVGTPVTYAGVTFTVTAGTTPFAAFDTFYFEVVPVAASYTMAVPRDLTLERLGTATGAAQVLTAGNSPIYWGRQVVFERTALVGAAATSTAASNALVRYLVVDVSTVPGVAVNDRLVIAPGTPNEEYVQVARIETTDPVTGADYGTQDRLYFGSFLRYSHAVGTTVQECTLTARREGLDYFVFPGGGPDVTLWPNRFTAGNPVVMSYRSHARAGYWRAAGEPFQAIYTPATGESDEIGPADGDWTALPVVDGTYKVGMWSNIDFTVTPLGDLTTPGAWNNLATDNTTYRMMAPPATKAFLLGSATTLEVRDVIADEQSCNKCHGEIAAHGFGRRGLETCLLCHSSAGAEDAPLYSFNGWYIGPTPRVTMDFRTMLHRIHMGKELTNGAAYVTNGIFLGTAYPVRYDDIGFPTMPGGVTNCTTCHGANSTGWLEPAPRNHPSPAVAPTRAWQAACMSCHDSVAAEAHADAMTGNGVESCAVCHRPGSELGADRVHRGH
jgi:hypothetical protein